MSEFVLPEGAFDLPTEVGLSDSPGLTTGTVKMAVHDPDCRTELEYSFALGRRASGLRAILVTCYLSFFSN